MLPGSGIWVDGVQLLNFSSLISFTVYSCTEYKIRTYNVHIVNRKYYSLYNVLNTKWVNYELRASYGVKFNTTIKSSSVSVSRNILDSVLLNSHLVLLLLTNCVQFNIQILKLYKTASEINKKIKNNFTLNNLAYL